MLRLMFSFTGHESMELCLGSSLGQGRVLAMKPSVVAVASCRQQLCCGMTGDVWGQTSPNVCLVSGRKL